MTDSTPPPTSEPTEVAVTDPLHDALREATMAVLLGTNTAPVTGFDPATGQTFEGTATIQSAFVARIQQMAYKGDLDEPIMQALALVDPAAIAREFETMFAAKIIEGLERPKSVFGSRPEGWLQGQAKGIAVDACKAALADDEQLIDRLRTVIGAEVDRNRVGIQVTLSDPEPGHHA